MSFIQAVLLGIVQGFTEFLPISSSAHLIIAQSFIPGFVQPGVLFDVILHAGTLIAVLVFFRKKLFSLTFSQLFLLGIATIPAAGIGLLFQSQLEASFGNLRWVGIELIITGVLNYLIDFAKTTTRKINVVSATWIGLWQALAIIPGISRSSATIFAATSQGISRDEAADFSFLLSIPAIAGAIIVQILSHGFSDGVSVGVYIGGMTAAFVCGLASISFLISMLKKKNFKIFAVYCVVVGIATIALAQ